MDQRLEFLLKRHNVHVRLQQNIPRPAYLTKFPTHAELAIQFGVHGAELNEVVAIQLARLMLGHLDQLGKDDDTKRAEWREALSEAARLLIADDLVERAEQGAWEPARLAAASDATALLAHVRLEERLSRRGVVSDPGDGTGSPEARTRRMEAALGRMIEADQLKRGFLATLSADLIHQLGQVREAIGASGDAATQGAALEALGHAECLAEMLERGIRE